MALIVCPGYHDRGWTASCLHALDQAHPKLAKARHVFPAEHYPASSGHHLRQFIADQGISARSPLVFLAFSAGCVAAATTAAYWTHQGGTVPAVIAVDGWGVPLAGAFAIHRLSHDRWTHTSSGWLGQGLDNFWAEPGVPHGQLWQDPEAVQGWREQHTDNGWQRSSTTALAFLIACLRQYPEAGEMQVPPA
jgi:hypothetical protein